MSTTLTLSAPAKLNLFLHITGRRSDGYHELQTIFQLTDLGDRLSFTPKSNGGATLSSNLPELANDDNLILRALNLLERHCQQTLPVDIYLDKILPMGGGIGGGSSDAATTLLALNALFELNLNESALLLIAQKLGADVPVFVKGCSAWAEGIGERLTPLELPEHWFILIHPQVHVSTPKLFAHPQLTRNTAVSTIRPALADDGHNDFEPLVRALYPEVEDAFQKCAPIGNARLTGSGACLYIKMQDEMTAREAHNRLRQQAPDLTTFLCKGVNESPVISQLRQFRLR